MTLIVGRNTILSDGHHETASFITCPSIFFSIASLRCAEGRFYADIAPYTATQGFIREASQRVKHAQAFDRTVTLGCFVHCTASCRRLGLPY